MKTLFFLITFALLRLIGFSQDKETLAKMDTTAFKGKAFLNKAVVIRQFIEPLRERAKSKGDEKFLTVSSRYFEALADLLERADLKDKPKPKEVTTILGRSRDEIAENNIIPIGILNADAVVLTEAQVNDNVKAKEQNKKADSKDYENIEIIAVGLLQSETFQADVQFRISPSLVQTNNI